ncbi:MAG: protein-(glutamine-N5) methyltransferase, release factor-specific [Curvibacter sp. GWA2_64_110]|nr:MAG: protein-(glutamine-N5) methyltransferase, release factor-specific [Curvibacter sp. GWA2_64_110]HCY15825.1 peptide chain release factor N(5)-glutamine methyltransferase [Curvibacter sp.]
MPEQRISEALTATQAQGIPRLDAQLLLLHALGRLPHERAWLLAHDSDELNTDTQNRFLALVQRRVGGEPLAYLTGIKEFFGLPLQVDARVLDPRPDTETLVEWALECMAALPAPRVIDLGTGSGAIALALKHSRPDAQVSAVDASAEALAVAQANAQRLGLDVAFRQGNWLAGMDGTFDLIVSNPPYIAEGDPHLAALGHEPRQALTAGADGLDDIRTLAAQAPARLCPGGWLLLEHGWDQAAAVRALLAAAGLEAVQSRRDLSGIERCSGGRLP